VSRTQGRKSWYPVHVSQGELRTHACPRHSRCAAQGARLLAKACAMIESSAAIKPIKKRSSTRYGAKRLALRIRRHCVSRRLRNCKQWCAAAGVSRSRVPVELDAVHNLGLHLGKVGVLCLRAAPRSAVRDRDRGQMSAGRPGRKRARRTSRIRAATSTAQRLQQPKSARTV
jgi:hypothetical protein